MNTYIIHNWLHNTHVPYPNWVHHQISMHTCIHSISVTHKTNIFLWTHTPTGFNTHTYIHEERKESRHTFILSYLSFIYKRSDYLVLESACLILHTFTSYKHHPFKIDYTYTYTIPVTLGTRSDINSHLHYQISLLMLSIRYLPHITPTDICEHIYTIYNC